MQLEDQDDQWLVTYALSYALPRQSVAPSIMAAWLQRHWPQLTTNTRGFVLREILEHVRDGRAGDDKIDKPMWVSLVGLLMKDCTDEEAKQYEMQLGHIEGVFPLIKNMVARREILKLLATDIDPGYREQLQGELSKVEAALRSP